MSRRAATVAQPASANPDGFGTYDWALFLAISVIWGSSFLFIAQALEGLTPGVVTFGRVGLGAVTMWLLNVVGGKGIALVDRSDWPRIVLLSVVWVAVPFTLFPLAQQHVSSAVTGLLNGATPIFAAAISILWNRRLPSGMQRAGLVIGFVGVVLISAPALDAGANEVRGITMILGATVCYGIALNLVGPLQQRYGAMTVMTLILTLATLWLVPVLLRDLGGNEFSFQVTWPVVLIGVVGTGVAYWIMATLVGRVGPIRASFITYLIPVVALMLGVIFRNDVVAPIALIGAALVLCGALIASRAD